MIRRMQTAVLLAGVLSGFASADESRLRELVAQLDDDDLEKREAAMRPLIDASDAVDPLLEAAARDGSVEVQWRAAKVIRERKVRAVLRRPENARLLEKYDAVTGNDLAKRREAIQGWVDGLSRTVETVDALLEMNAIDPSGAGGAANEALNWLCAPRLTATMAERNVSMSGPACSAKEMVERLLEFRDVPLRMTDAAEPRLAQTMMSGSIEGEMLDILRECCTLAGISYRVDEREGAVILETADETNAFWAEWWKSMRDDVVSRIDLGLEKAPDGATLTREQVAAWLLPLESPDAYRSRVARSILKEIPEALFPVIDARAKGGHRAAADLRDRLAMRALGRIAFVRWGSGPGKILITNLDGSAERVLLAECGASYSLTAAPDGTAVYAVRVEKENRTSAWRFDPDGREAPVKLGEGGEDLEISPGGRWAASWDKGKAMRLVEFGNGEPLTFGGEADRPAVWTADGKVAWSCRATSSLWIFDTESRKALEITDCRSVSLFGFHADFHWSPDGAFVAVPLQGHADDAQPEDRSVTVGVFDAQTGKRRAVSISHRDVTSLCWSHDAKRLAFAVLPPPIRILGDPTAVDLLLLDPATGKETPVKTPASPPIHATQLVFHPDGTSLLVWTGDGMWRVDIESGAATPFPTIWSSAEWLPGKEWFLGSRGDVWLRHRDGARSFTVVETDAEEVHAVFVPPRKP